MRATAALAVGVLGLVAGALPASAKGGHDDDENYEEAPPPEEHTDVPEDDGCGDYTPSCPDEVTIELTGELATDATFTDEESGLEITVTGVAVDEEGNVLFDLTSNYAISAVFVKAGEEAELFEFDEHLTAIVGLTSPTSLITEISFCFDKDQPPPTTLPEETTTTTAPEETTTTTAPEETTTTTAPGEETTSTTVAPSSTVTTAPSTTTTAGEELPNTGSNSTMMLVAVGAALLAVGAALVLGTRKMWRRNAA